MGIPMDRTFGDAGIDIDGVNYAAEVKATRYGYDAPSEGEPRIVITITLDPVRSDVAGRILRSVSYDAEMELDKGEAWS